MENVDNLTKEVEQRVDSFLDLNINDKNLEINDDHQVLRIYFIVLSH